MGELLLITGGARSGKSDAAQRLVEAWAPPRIYVATCPLIDDELRRRVDAHRQARSGRGWTTVEQPGEDLAKTLRDLEADAAVLVDCLALWVNNLMYRAARSGVALDEARVAAAADEVARAALGRARPVVIVTNEVGMGIVPSDAAARLYRDLLGRCNQRIAAAASSVTLMCAGIAVPVKSPATSSSRQGAP